MAIMQRHKVLPRVLTKLVDISPMPKPSAMITTKTVNNASSPRKIITEGFFKRYLVKRVFSIALILRCPALEGDDAAWPELDKEDNENDHVGLRRQGV